MQTDLRRILSVSGQHGLYRYLAQARNGAVAEGLADRKRTVFTGASRITTLADIAIYTSEGEMKLADVFLAMKETLGETEPLSCKAADKDVLDFFAKAIPDYDADRFYLSHMRKVLDWYEQLVKYASLDFVKEDEGEEEA